MVARKRATNFEKFFIKFVQNVTVLRQKTLNTEVTDETIHKFILPFNLVEVL